MALISVSTKLQRNNTDRVVRLSRFSPKESKLIETAKRAVGIITGRLIRESIRPILGIGELHVKRRRAIRVSRRRRELHRLGDRLVCIHATC